MASEEPIEIVVEVPGIDEAFVREAAQPDEVAVRGVSVARSSVDALAAIAIAAPSLAVAVRVLAGVARERSPRTYIHVSESGLTIFERPDIRDGRVIILSANSDVRIEHSADDVVGIRRSLDGLLGRR